MARSTYIYLVFEIDTFDIYAFTVKHEAQSFINREGAEKFLRVQRHLDAGGYTQPVIMSVAEFLETK